ncbi:MAG: hypothetical protein WCP06_06650 [Verrucomicrobiota bacterium]
MQTTLRIDDQLYREAKSEAAREGLTLTRFLEDALRLRLQKARATAARVPIRFRTYRKGEAFPFNDGQLKEIANSEQEARDAEKLKFPPR